MLSIAVLISIFIDKTYAFGYILKPTDMTPEYCHAKIFIGTYLLRVVIFVAPLTIAGSTDEGKVRAGAILAGIGGAIYSFIRWFMDQREVSGTRITCMNPAETAMMLQSLGIMLVLAKIALRDRFLLGTIHRHVPVAVPLELAAHEVEI
jgi:drug/metabolite transporter (DMT)-like permease